MGQEFKLINIDTMEAESSSGKYSALFADECADVIGRLTAPVDPSEWAILKTGTGPGPRRTRPDFLSRLCMRTSQTSTTALLKLPVELLDVIAKQIEQYGHLLCFALACSELWQATESARYQSLRQHLRDYSWAGDRIIFLGDNARELPDQVLYAGEDEWLASQIPSDELQDYESDGERLYAVACRLNNYHPFTYTPYLMPSHRHGRMVDIVCQRELRSIREAESWVSFRPADFTLRHAPSTSPDDRWMLRNLTKRELVIRSRGGSPSVLSPVLISLVSWSDCPALSIEQDSELKNSLLYGRWAGDEIDVTLYSLHDAQKDSDGSEWKDITKEVIERLYKIARSEREEWSANEF